MRVVSLLLRGWKQQLTHPELLLITAHCDGLIQPDTSDPLPDLKMFPVFKCEGLLLKLKTASCNTLSTMTGKTMYYLLVKILNQSRLEDRSDSPWRTHLALTEAQRPEWRALYKPPLTKRGGDLQWRVLHGAVAVNAFVSVINPDVADTCPFCPQRETLFHCFLECGRLSSLFLFLIHLFALFDEVFSDQMFILGYKYNSKNKMKCQLFNFVLGQAKMAIYLCRRKKLGDSLDVDVMCIFRRMLKARLKTDFTFFTLTSNVKDFEKMWCLKQVLCYVKKDQLVFGHILD